MAASTHPPEQPNAVDAAMARIGAPLDAAWRLDELIGVVGMASVFAGTHASGARAALKVLHVELARDPYLRERFLREGKIAAHVDHPGRVEILGEGVSDRGEPFLVLELLVGSTLERLLRRKGGTLPIEQVFPVFDAVLDLLEACHAAGVVHRDIKPANIYITGTGAVKVLDFGIARLRDPERQISRVGQTFGTPAFMSPEQAMGLDSIDGRADLWSVGACIFAALAGRPPHDGRSEGEAYLLAATQPAPSLSQVAPELPAEVAAFVDRALSFERARRFQSAASMRAELRAILAELAASRATPAPAARRGAACDEIDE
ncbi:MAG: serine/threonine protein kinase, partial [Polyangiaceae bacterium]|nr:serine/threonine protein kinase [Polyangiaceae bacterium]